jgi:pimeloyl-ACP methyl ester carboxylesterase
MQILAALLTFSLFSGFAPRAQAHALTHTGLARGFVKGFVQVRSDQRLYVEHRKAAPGKPTLFLLNGLTYSTAQWQPLVSALDRLDPHIGIVLYDMEGMGKTLLAKAPVNFDIPIDHQLRDLKDLVRTLAPSIEGPSVLAGLSYGGGLGLEYMARHPDDFQSFISMAPFLYRLPDQDQWIQKMIRLTRSSFPSNPASDDDLYDYFLKILVYTTYPSAEPIIYENPFKIEALFRMVKGVKNWRAADSAALLPRGKLHLMAGATDPYVKLPWLKEYWESLPTATARASFVVFELTPHKLPEERPEFSAQWIMHVLRGNQHLNKGLTFIADPIKGEARSGDIVIPMVAK